ncbi:hypothetical protein [Alteromonas sp. ASW11-130]|uniref:hypothetical protein n=1 Tax=Alteromonas sp. ASW11-130 TaxID=3015775 RepID=UPI002242BEF3|nr:hypothetical protein [Alteromonas sp. ASW11-130]MCW8091144.1 hypothetical protein [Alteromonas sp. ASW11-130]
MQLSYLCAKHADWIYNNPQHATHFLQRDELQGVMLFYEGHYTEAIPYLGCAFDIAAILLELEEDDSFQLREKIESLNCLLTQAYEIVGRVDYQQAIAERTGRLLQALRWRVS